MGTPATRCILVAFWAVAFPLLEPTAGVAESAAKLPPVSVGNSELHRVVSERVGDEFTIMVALPDGYAGSDKSYPLVVVLDANGFFGMVTDTARALLVAKEIPEPIIVGIGYPDLPDVTASIDIRTRDLTPTEDEAWSREFLAGMGEWLGRPFDYQGSGGAAAFHQFIQGELMPLLDATYRIDDSSRTLVGHSLSGLFGLYVLFHDTDSFDNYLIGSPSVFWDGKIVNRYEADYETAHDDLAARVFMSTGDLEGEEPIADIIALGETLRDRGYPGLELTVEVFENETHVSSPPVTFSRGLRVLLGP